VNAPTQARPAIPGGPQSAAAVLDAGLASHPEREALVGRHGRYTWTHLDAEANRAARALTALGVGGGDRVAMALPNDVDIVVGFLACMRLGAVWLGISLALAPPEKTYMVEDSDASILLTTPEIVASIRSPARVIAVDPAGTADEWRALVASADDARLDTEVDPFAPAAIAYTSGTTGLPKGVVHSQHNLLLPGAVARARAQYTVDDRIGVVLPLTLVNLIALGPLLAWQGGTTCVAIDRIDAPGLAGWIRDERVTAVSTVPTIMHDLLTHPEVAPADLETLRKPGVGGADCPESFRDLYRRTFGAEVTVGYGLTEAPTAVTMTEPERPAVPGSAGRALPHVRIAICGPDGTELGPGEVGEICVGPATGGAWADVYTPMLGYWGRPAETAEAIHDGMLHTGDLGSIDANGELFVRDRRHDLIIRGGANVYPAEVERVLHDDSRVAACAVVGRPDERLGERVVAFVEPVEGSHFDADELLAHCRVNLAAYKVPEEILFVDRFERTAMGKIVKTDLRRRLRSGGGRTAL